MNIRERVTALEQKRSMGPRATTPPIEFFDRIIAGTVTEQEWNRWAPWLIENLGTLSDEPVERLDRDRVEPVTGKQETMKRTSVGLLDRAEGSDVVVSRS